jgi:hypothetical protein
MPNENFLDAARAAFCETISLKLQQLRRVVPKNTNSALTGDFVEELVRGFIKDWISPCLLLSGTMYPHDSCPPDEVAERFREGLHAPKQIDGIIFDPRLGPPIIKEGSFAVAHPAFCRGIVEIKTSETDLLAFEMRLRCLYHQYMSKYEAMTPQVMGIVLQDSDPAKHSQQHWQPQPLYHYNLIPHCPIFILFDDDFQPHMAAIDAMMRAIFRGSIHFSRPSM